MASDEVLDFALKLGDALTVVLQALFLVRTQR
jgi:hypothetical protein